MPTTILSRLRPLRTAIALAAISGVTAASASAHREVAFRVPANSHVTQKLAVARDLNLRYVLVNGESLVYGVQAGPNTAYMYGEGLVLRFFKRRHTYYVRAASAASAIRRVVVSFSARR